MSCNSEQGSSYLLVFQTGHSEIFFPTKPHRYIKNKGEFHMNNPDMSRALHRAVRNKEPLAYEEYRRQIMDGRPVTAIRDLLDFDSDRQPIPL